MSEPITPALTAEEWRITSAAVARDFAITALKNEFKDEYGECMLAEPLSLPAVIALANTALPDADPRKITWAMVDALRNLFESSDFLAYEEPGHRADHEETKRVGDLAYQCLDAIASYLPPRP